MKRLLFLVAFITLAMSSMAQNVDADRVNIRKNFTMPFLDTLAAAIKIGEERTRPQDSLVWYWQGLRWVNLRGVVSVKDTIPLFHIGLGSPALRPIYAINGVLRASNWGAGYGWVPRLLGDSTMVGDVDTTSIAYKQWIINNFGPGGPLTIGFQNGLSLIGSNAELGANPLLHNTTIDMTGLYTLSMSGSSSNTVLNVFSTSSGLAAQIQSSSGIGANISTLTGAYALSAGITPASTNTAVKVLNVLRTTSGTAAIGMGGFIGYQLNDAGNFTQESGRLEFDWTDAAHATFTSQFHIRGAVSSTTTDWATIDAVSGMISNGTTNGFTSANASNTGFSSSGANIGFSSVSGSFPAYFRNSNGSTSGSNLGLALGRSATYNGAIGNGVYIQFEGHDNAGSSIVNSYIQGTIIDVTAGATKGMLSLQVKDGSGGNPIVGINVKGISTGVATYATPTMPVYASNALALAGGLGIGDHYRNGDADNVVH